jgi:maltose O-acetyltransferase
MIAKTLVYEYNSLSPEKFEQGKELLRKLLGASGTACHIEPPFRVDYGYNTSLGENFYSNYNLIILDCAPVTIGDNVFIAPNVSICTAGHPIHHEPRSAGFEYAFAITIGNNVWIGANVVINPGVTIGDNTVIGSGSVVTKAMPANVVAVGNPCRVMREIREEERDYYFGESRFPV